MLEQIRNARRVARSATFPVAIAMLTLLAAGPALADEPSFDISWQHRGGELTADVTVTQLSGEQGSYLFRVTYVRASGSTLEAIDGEREGAPGFRAKQCRVLHGADIGVDPGMTERRNLLQDLNQVLSAKLAGSTASRNELRQTHLVHGTPRVAGGQASRQIRGRPTAAG